MSAGQRPRARAIKKNAIFAARLRLVTAQADQYMPIAMSECCHPSLHAEGHHHAHHHHVGAHAHHHGHHHALRDATGRRLLWASIINIAFTVLEAVGGLLSNSLSLLSDALHNLSDSLAIFVAYVAHLIGRRKPDARKTFGYKRFEIIAAFLNSIVLIAVCVYLFIEAYRRLVGPPEPIRGLLMLLVALAGLLANVVSVFILQHDRERNLNVRAAYLHLMGDTLSSVAVIAGGLCIWLWEGMAWLDPLITVLVGGYIIWHAWRLLRESTNILMQGAPPSVEVGQVRGVIAAFPEVADMHHIHLWRLNDEQLHLEAHVRLQRDLTVGEASQLRDRMASALSQRLSITHITLQMEYGGCSDAGHAGMQCLE